MLAALRQLFSADPLRIRAQEAYVEIVKAARTPTLFTEGGVPDTLDGRFDALVLHLFLVQHRLKREPDPAAKRFSRYLSEAFVSDMDRNMREMGVGDTGVSHRIKRMGSALLGRLQAYEQALENPAAFREALTRNLYRGNTPPPAQLDATAAYMQKQQSLMQTRSLEDLYAGKSF